MREEALLNISPPPRQALPSTSPQYCKSKLTDDDGLGSIISVVSELKREIKCRDYISQEDWNVIKEFLSERSEALRNYCHRAICSSQPDAIFQEILTLLI